MYLPLPFFFFFFFSLSHLGFGLFMVTDILEVKLSVKNTSNWNFKTFSYCLLWNLCQFREKILYFFIILVVSFCIVIADTVPTPFYIWVILLILFFPFRVWCACTMGVNFCDVTHLLVNLSFQGLELECFRGYDFTVVFSRWFTFPFSSRFH